jgi:hypothetical protein
MPLHILDVASAASGDGNEDRAGSAGAMAWVIDGATDVVEQRLTSFPTDAAWFAERLDRELTQLAPDFSGDLGALPERLAAVMAQALDEVACRAPRSRSEHPSAAGIIIRATSAGLDYAGLGDCALIARAGDGQCVRIGVDEEHAGDAWVQEEIRGIRAGTPSIDQSEARALLWPRLRAARERMNRDGGYGVFSITAPPRHFIKAGHIPMPAGGLILLASDGLTRLVEVFRRHTSQSLLDAAARDGVASLIADVRHCEHDDVHCVRHPRAKTSDDATGLLLRFTPE